MIYPRRGFSALCLLGALLSACGGGGGGDIASSGPISSGGGIGGTGLTSSGTIDAFGSIFVNGVEFKTDEAEIIIDSENGSADDLGLGMVVIVSGTINSDGTTGNAVQIIFDDEIQGPINTITNSADGDTKLLDILGIEVIVERTGTVYEDVTFDTLAIGDLVEVSGFPNEDLQLRATRIEKKTAFIAGSSEIELKGVVSNLTGTTFNLGDFLVDFSNADLSDLPGSVVSNGLTVEVHGTLMDQLIEADRIEEEDDLSDSFEEDGDVELKGTITDYISDSDFSVNGVTVDASGATRSPQGLSLGNGVVVEVEGSWNGSILVASEVEARRGRMEIEAAVASVDTAANTITLQLFPGTVLVQLDSKTRLDDDTDAAEDLGIADLTSGDFLEVEAVQSGDSLLATRIDRDDRDDDILQAPVEAFTPGVDITILGITYSTAGAEFENQNDDSISSGEFYTQLQIGDLVKVKDEDIADGIADEVEFEEEDDLDGDREFDDDCDSNSNDSEDDSDGTCGSGEDDEPGDGSSGSGEDDEPDEPDDDSSGG